MSSRVAALVLALAACAPTAPAPSANQSSATPSPSPTLASGSPGIGPAFADCAAANPQTRVLAALASVAGYTFRASGFAYVPTGSGDPAAPPRTVRAPARLEGRYVAPDRLYRLEQVGGPESATVTIAVGRDLWISDGPRWQPLSGAAQPTEANVIASLVRDAGPGWEPAQLSATQLPGEGCAFRNRSPLPSAGKGYRETTFRADATTGLPAAARLTVRDAVDPLGNRHDSDLLYRVAYGAVAPIEAPTSSPAP